MHLFCYPDTNNTVTNTTITTLERTTRPYNTRKMRFWVGMQRCACVCVCDKWPKRWNGLTWRKIEMTILVTTVRFLEMPAFDYLTNGCELWPCFSRHLDENQWLNLPNVPTGQIGHGLRSVFLESARMQIDTAHGVLFECFMYHWSHYFLPYHFSSKRGHSIFNFCVQKWEHRQKTVPFLCFSCCQRIYYPKLRRI